MSNLLQKDTSQILILDVQERLLPVMDDPDRVTNACTILMEAGTLLDIPVTISEQYPNKLGSTVLPLQDAAKQVDIFEKNHFSCLADDTLKAHLSAHKNNGRSQIVIGGIETHICVLQTALQSIEAGFETFIVSDATSSRKIKSQELAEERLRTAGAHIITLEMALFEWLGKAGSKEFKTLSKRIK